MRLSENFVESFKKRHSVILGMTRSGKTFFAGRILERLQNQGVHTLFVDPKHDKDYEHLGTLCYSTMEVLEQIMLNLTPLAMPSSGFIPNWSKCWRAVLYRLALWFLLDVISTRF